MNMSFTPVAHIENDFTGLFGIPRQGGICDSLLSRIVWEEGYVSPEALRGLEGFSHLWLVWVFSRHSEEGWHPTVRPPKLGGNRRVGVYATRSPFRPNPIGLSAVRLVSIEKDLSLVVSGADLLNGTPILDVKPYLPYCDSIPGAKSGFAPAPEAVRLRVEDPRGMLLGLPCEKRDALRQILSEDPRPGYVDDPGRVFGLSFGGLDFHFTVKGGVLTVLDSSK